MKKKKPIKLMFTRLIVLLALGAISRSYGQIPVNINITKTISSACYSCAVGDSIDLNSDDTTDVYVKIQQWNVSYGPHSKVANALLIWGAANDSVAGGCLGGGTLNTLDVGDTIGNNTDWNKMTHPFYLEPGMPWVCDCDCGSEQTVYIGLRFITTGGTRYGWLQITFTKFSYTLVKGAYMTGSSPIIIPED